MTDEDRKYFQTLMDDVHRQFIRVVETERGITHKDAVNLADGRVFTGEQALHNGLVDTLGTYEEAIMITAELAGIEGEPALVKERKRRSVFDSLFDDVAESLSDFTQEVKNRPVLSFRFTGPY
jgi:protease-4